MKKILPIITLLSLFVVGCYGNESSQSNTQASKDNSSISTSVSSFDSSSSSSFSSSSSEVPPSDDEVKIKIYATNDIHGQIFPEDPDSYNGRLGLGKTMTFLLQFCLRSLLSTTAKEFRL